MLTIRWAEAGDVSLMVEFIRALAEYERAPEEAVVTEADLLRDGFGDVPRFGCLLAFWDGEAAGFALWFHSYSTWKGHVGVHLEDLFVHPHLRRRGIGTALLRRVAGVAAAEGCPRLEWTVLKWNRLAIGLYEELGAEELVEWAIMRVSGEGILKLGGQND